MAVRPCSREHAKHPSCSINTDHISTNLCTTSACRVENKEVDMSTCPSTYSTSGATRVGVCAVVVPSVEYM